MALDPMPDPDGHRWVSPDCADCECCTAALCRTARDRGVPCDTLVSGGPGVMSVSGCPCAQTESARPVGTP